MKLLDRILGRDPTDGTPRPATATPKALAIGDTAVSAYQPQTGRIMATNGGPHPPDAWAHVTAQHIAPVDPNTTGARHTAALKLQIAIAEALLPHHTNVQAVERGKLQTINAHLATALDATPHLNDAILAVQAAAKGTPWEDHFQQPDVVALIRQELACHFMSVQHIERSWHVDRNPAHPYAQSWRAVHHPGV